MGIHWRGKSAALFAGLAIATPARSQGLIVATGNAIDAAKGSRCDVVIGATLPTGWAGEHIGLLSGFRPLEGPVVIARKSCGGMSALG
jgi:hypothetical protein